MNAPSSPHNIVTGAEASSQPPSLALSPALDVEMAAVSSVSFGTSTAAVASSSVSSTQMEVEDTAASETAPAPAFDQPYLLYRTPASPSPFNPAAWTGQIIGSGGGGGDPAMAQNRPPPPAAAAFFSTPSLVRDGPPSVDADSNHLLRSATLYASPDLAALTAIATTTTTTTTTTSNNNNNNNVPTNAAYYRYGYPQVFTPAATMTVPMTTIDGRVVGAATSCDDLPPTGTTPPLPTPLPVSTHRICHPGRPMFAATPLAAGGISRSFFTPGGSLFDLHAPSVEDVTMTTTPQAMETSNSFGFSMANYALSTDHRHRHRHHQQQEQQQQQQQPRLNHPGAPFSSLTVAAINAAQMAATTITDTAAAAAMAQIEVEMDAEQNQDESFGADAKSNASKKKRGGIATAGSKAKKPKATSKRKARPLPTASNRPPFSAAAAIATLPIGDSNATTGRYGSARVSDGASRPFTQEEKDATRCRCQKSRCLKLYCDCFQSGAMCKDDCNCKSCGNTATNSKRQGVIDEILARKPEAFMLRAAPKADVGCRCKRSRCLKLYCACFKAGTDCGDECICTDCANVGGGGGGNSKPAAEPTATVETAKPITPRAPPQCWEPAMAAEKIDVAPTFVLTAHAAV